jgi:hypothetical protein
MGGVFNYVNFHVYHYSANNPIKYIDPDGRSSFPTNATETVIWGNEFGNTDARLMSRVRMGDGNSFPAGISSSGPCLAIALIGVAQTYADKNLLPSQVSEILNDPSLYNSAEGVQNSSGIISRALDMLGEDVSNLNINVVTSPDSTAAKGAFATIRGVGTRNNTGSTSGHFQEGTAMGDFRWDPVDGTTDIGRKVGEIRNVFITPKRPDE